MSVAVSILLITHNHERYIERAIASIESQHTDRTIEVVVADDASTDRTRALVTAWASTSRMSVRVLPKAGHLGITRNYARGFAACHGEYIAVLEGDDEWISVEKIERQAAALDENRHLTMSANRVLLYDDASGASVVIPTIGSVSFLTEISDQQLARSNWFATFSCCMYRADVLRSLDPSVFEVTAYDWLVNMAVTAHGNAAFLPEVMTLYRQHAGGEWSQRKQRDRDTQLQALIPEYIRILGPRVAHDLTRAARETKQRLRASVFDKGSVPTLDPALVALPIPRVSLAQPPRVSVVMTVYNHREYVLEAVNSVLDQTIDDIELIVVDDGSIDGSITPLADLDDPRLRVYQLGQNLGAAAALNIAIQQTRANLIAVINSDDVWEPLKLARQLTVFDETPDVGAVFTGVRLIGEDGKSLSADQLPEWHQIFRQRNRTQAAWLRRFFDGGNCLCHPSVLIRREFYEKHGLMDNRLRQIPDLRQWITLVKHYPIVVLGDEELVRFRILADHANASSQSAPNLIRGVREHLEVNEHFFEDVSDQQLLDGFGDVLRDTDFNSPLERACAVAFLWLDVPGSIHPLNRAQGLRELRALLGDPEAALILRDRYQFTDISLHELSRLSDDLPAIEQGKWVATSAGGDHAGTLTRASAAELLGEVRQRLRQGGLRRAVRAGFRLIRRRSRRAD